MLLNKFLQIVFLSTLILLISCTEDTVDPPAPITSPQASTFPATFAVEWTLVTIEIVKLQTIPAPVASRLYGYSGITLYESVHYGIPGSRSLAGQLNNMPAMPTPENVVYDWPAVMAAAMRLVLSQVLYQPSPHSLNLIEARYSEQIDDRLNSIDEAIVNRSIAFGEQVGNKIVEWAATDGFLDTRGMPYIPPSRTINPMFWEPTLPGQSALEPYMGTHRAFCMTNQNECSVPLDIPFDTIPGTPFYNDGYEVLDVSRNLTYEQVNIALFWEDKAGTGQPPGHWVSITNNMISRFSLNLADAVKIHALIAAGLRDAFISCWEAKYRINLLRPKTYIRDYLGEPDWDEIIVTPPFPEYPSGHSMGSGCSALILTTWFGDNIAFTDSTHNNEPGLRNRQFSSFNDAANEAAISRIYGGIHFRTACENGLEQGRLVANVVLSTIQFE
jgi:hypothetical protein